MKKGIYIIGGLVVLGIAYYGISPLFNNVVVDDALPPEVTEEKSVEQEVIESGGGFMDLSDDDQKTMMSQMAEVEKDGPIVMNDSLEDLSIELAEGGVPEVEESEEEEEEEEVVTPTVSEVIPTGGHPASGTVRVIDTAEGQIIRYEDFKTINGPRLHVYLAKDLGADEFIDLGPIRGTEGNINYTVPEGTDLNEYKYVMYWCVPFGVLFNYADVSG